jgi:hypothetical protein
LPGDWGGLPIFPYRTFVQQAIAYQMAQWASLSETHFQLTLGDNFYFSGVDNVDDARFAVNPSWFGSEQTRLNRVFSDFSSRRLKMFSLDRV